MVLNKILSPEYAVYSSDNGQDGIRMAEVFLPDIILLDILMLDMDGYDVIVELKKNELNFFLLQSDERNFDDTLASLQDEYGFTVAPYSANDVESLVSPDYWSYLETLRRSFPDSHRFAISSIEDYWRDAYTLVLSDGDLARWLADTESEIQSFVESFSATNIVQAIVVRPNYKVITVYINDRTLTNAPSAFTSDLEALTQLMLRYQCLIGNTTRNVQLSVKNDLMSRIAIYEEREEGFGVGTSDYYDLKLPLLDESMFGYDWNIVDPITRILNDDFFFEDRIRDPGLLYEEMVYELSLRGVVLKLSEAGFVLTMSPATYDAWLEELYAEIVDGFTSVCALEERRGLAFELNDDLTVIELRDEIDDENSLVQNMLLPTFNRILRYQQLLGLGTPGFKVVYSNKDKGIYRTVQW